jgi:branched-chain amino acid transport system substrate-binding protein
MRGFGIGLALALACTAGSARAEISGDVVRVGVLNDISGIFQDTNGMGSVEAARMAAEDFNGGGKGIKVEIVYADHQNKADVGSAIAANGSMWRVSTPSSTCRTPPSASPSTPSCATAG